MPVSKSSLDRHLWLRGAHRRGSSQGRLSCLLWAIVSRSCTTRPVFDVLSQFFRWPSRRKIRASNRPKECSQVKILQEFHFSSLLFPNSCGKNNAFSAMNHLFSFNSQFSFVGKFAGPPANMHRK